MLKRSRVSNALDTSRAGAALARPGMDTRNWLLYAQVTAVKMDEDEGPLVDVLLLPDGDPETVRLGAFYSGPNFGAYFPVEEGDLVIVSIPSGDYDHGGVIVSRVWTPAEPPSDLMKNAPDDMAIVVKKDKNMRLRVYGQGNLVVGCDKGKVYLGDEPGEGVTTQPVARKADPVDLGTWQCNGVGSAFAGLLWLPPGSDPTAIPPPTPITIALSPVNLVGAVKDGSKKVESA